jgi:Virulence-associated protein E-like domain
MSDQLMPKADKSIAELAWLLKGAPFHLERMESTGKAKPVSKTYKVDEKESARRFVETNNSPTLARNMYFVANSECLNGARRKENLTAVRILQVDIDVKDWIGKEITFEEARDSILKTLVDKRHRPKGVPAPTLVTHTGGGYQAFWRLAETIDLETAELLNRALIEVFDGDRGTHDAVHLMRVPYTVNWLNDKKRSDGREPVLSSAMDRSEINGSPREYKLDDFAKLKRTNGSSRQNVPKAAEIVEFDALPLPDNLNEILPADTAWRHAIVFGDPPKGKSYSSRSEFLFAASVWMLAEGVAPGHVLSILLEPSLAIGDHIRDRSGGEEYAKRQVLRALALVQARDTDWPVTNKDGTPVINDMRNVRYALVCLGVEARRNLFTQTDEVTGAGLDGRDVKAVADIMTSRFAHSFGYNAYTDTIKRELVAIADENRYHPVLDYLDHLEWDGMPRLDTWLSDVCGAEDTPLHREFSAKTLIAAVRRIRSPGSKFDTMLVLEGEQGTGKSTLLRKLAVNVDWFCESLNLKDDDRTKAQVLDRAWIVECQELNGLNKTEDNALKKFISESVDTYRRPYEAAAHAHPRHCIIIGTTNLFDYLRDPTGNRRYWPVAVGRIDLKGFERVVDQLWAEASEREVAGERITLSEELWAVASEAQAQRLAEDPFADVLRAEFGDTAGRVPMEAVKALLGIETARMTHNDTRRIRAIMKSLGWEYGSPRFTTSDGTKKARRGFQRVDASLGETEFCLELDDKGVARIVPTRHVPF